MGKYNGAVITAAGQNLIAQAIAESKTVTFTTAQASSHVYPSSTDFEALTALTDVESTVNINYAGVYSDTVVQVSARFDNDGVETAYLINTLGFFAQLGTDTPILFAVSTAVTPDQMPVFDADNPSAFIYNMQITVQNADSINVSVNPAGTVTVEQLNTVTNEINAKIGNLASLTTDAKTSTVAAINEVDNHADNAQTTANKAQAMIAIVEIGDTCTHTGGIAKGQYVNWKGDLYTADSYIAVGATFASSGGSKNLTAVPDGGLNDLVKINGGTAVDLSGYTSSRRYTFPCDGYVTINSQSQTTGKMQVPIYGANNILVAALYMNVTGLNQLDSVFVRKGMNCFIYYATSGIVASFTPLI